MPPSFLRGNMCGRGKEREHCECSRAGILWENKLMSIQNAQKRCGNFYMAKSLGDRKGLIAQKTDPIVKNLTKIRSILNGLVAKKDRYYNDSVGKLNLHFIDSSSMISI